MSSTRESQAKARALGERVSLLIKKRHEGNAHEAAQMVGIPYRTLRRLAAGEIANPRADAIRKLSEFYGTTTDWLLEGKGPGPEVATGPDPDAPGERLAWAASLRRLALPEGLFNAARLLPNASAVALSGVGGLYTADGKVPKATRDLLVAAIKSEHRLWRELLEGVEQRFGRDAAVEFLKSALTVSAGRMPDE